MSRGRSVGGATRYGRILSSALALAVAGAGPLPAEQDDGHPHGEHADEHGRFEVRELEELGVTLATAVAGAVDVGIELPAEVRPNADRLAHLAAPFPGIVRKVLRSAGDAVKAGETLALIESENLTTYPLRAAFDGTVIDKHIAPGEAVARDRILFVVADLSDVWVEIDVYLNAIDLVGVGRSVRLATPDGSMTIDGKVSYVSSIVDQATRTVTARVVLANPDGRWRPGLFVNAFVARPVEAAVVVPRRALHEIEGRTVVFAVEEDHFEARPVIVGVVGRSNAEIKGGLKPGERFADESSFLVKAELLKGEAGHEH
jgi:cobalt-zinc-cadmium efflux system membrane fusion protein